MTDVRHALPSDEEPIVAALTQAFRTDPLMRLLFPDADHADLAGEAALAAMMRAEFGVHLPHGHLYVIDHRAAALWTPPGVMADAGPLSEVVGTHADSETVESALPAFLSMFECRPPEPHFYLAMVGVSDEARGRGLGTDLLRRVLDICDREAIVAHLESTNARNVSLYERQGFEVVSEIEFGPGVTVRPMTRHPVGADT